MKKLHLPILLLAAVLVLNSCNFPSSSATETVAPMDAINTAAAQTVIAMSTEMAQTPTPGAPASTQLPQDTAVPATNQPLPTLAPLATSTPAAGGVTTACDRARFIKDVSVPDDSSFAPGTSFTKTWRLQNAGTCSWNSNYRLIFDSGDAMSGPASISLPGNVAPGQEVDLSVNLKAPTTAGNYIGYWKLENASGRRFGLGDGDKAFWVKITTGVTPEPFAVTSANLSLDRVNVSASCPYTFDFKINMKVSAKGTVSYHLERSDGAKTSPKEVDFGEAGTKIVPRDWKFNESFSGWVKVYVDEPNHQFFPPLNVQLTCE